MDEQARRTLMHRRVARAMAPVASVLFHVALVILLLKFAVSGAANVEQQIQVTLQDEADVKEFESQLEDIPQPDTSDNAEEPQTAAEAPAMEAAPDVMETPEMGMTPSLAPLSPLTISAWTGNEISDAQLKRGGGGGSSAFGFNSGVKGDLVGAMYDLKRDHQGRARATDYWPDIENIIAAGLDDGAFHPYFEVPRKLYFTHLCIPPADAETGPAAFGVGDLMEPRGWVVHYSGHIQTVMAGRYRFAGMFDDMVIVIVDGQRVLDRRWDGTWAPKPGEWFEMKPLVPRSIHILVGERPGGKVGGMLAIEQEGAQYQASSEGWPIRPIFTVQPLTPTEQAEINKSPWKFDPRAPIMGLRNSAPRRETAPAKDEVSIEII